MSEAILSGYIAPSELAQKELCNLLQTNFNIVHRCKQSDFNSQVVDCNQKMTFKHPLGQVTLVRTTFYEATTAPSNLCRMFFFPLMGKAAAV
jgi:hypothetical protein